MPHVDDPPLVSVGLLALPDSLPGSLYGLYEVLSSAGVVWSELTGEPATARRLEVRILAPARTTFPCAMGTPVTPHASLAEAGRVDIVIVGDLAMPAVTEPHGRWPEATPWLRRQFAEGALVCSACTGSVLLAEAGLLDGLEATVHWAAADLLRRHYPAVRVRPERILALAGPEHRVVTSGGAASWEDLALYLIGRFCGPAEAVRTAKLFVLGDRSEGQLAFAAMTRPRRHEDAAIARCQAWLADHYAATNPVTRMAELSGLPSRSFVRRFKAATGQAPVDYAQTLRIEEAKQLLETTDQPTDAVGQAVGYADPTSFRRLFKRRTGVTPARYRQRFRTLHRAHGPEAPEGA